MIIIKAVGTILALAVFFSWYALPAILIMLLPYYFIIKKRTRHYIYPIIKFDFLMPFAVSLLWLIVGCISDANVKSMSNLVELFVLGKIWAATWLVRLAAICILRRKSEVVCLCSDMFVVLLTLLFAVIFPTLPE